MTLSQEKAIKTVYDRFISCEDESYWTNLDDLMEYCEYLTDYEVVTESEFKMRQHLEKGIKCNQDHPVEYCFAPNILDAVEAIVSIFEDTKILDSKYRYVLSYYLTLCQLNLLINES